MIKAPPPSGGSRASPGSGRSRRRARASRRRAAGSRAPRSRRPGARSCRGRCRRRLRITSGLSSSRISRRAPQMSQMSSFLGGSNSTWKMWPSLTQVRRPLEAADDLVVGDVDQDRHGESSGPAPASSSRAPRPEPWFWGKPSRMKPSPASSREIRARRSGRPSPRRARGRPGPCSPSPRARARCPREPRRAGCRRSRSRAVGSPPGAARPGFPCRTPAGRAGRDSTQALGHDEASSGRGRTVAKTEPVEDAGRSAKRA